MNSRDRTISHVPTNIITGFLGVGKTSTILHLLAAKPKNQRWAVLVNEFGEIGVDGAMFEGRHKEEEGVFITEVPGGCMCCTAGVPMQIALNRLLLRSRPDRLLIEPTGLGHPREVLEVLSDEHNAKVLRIKNSITLVDARKLRDERYTTHSTFNQQIEIADIVVGNKSDLYREGDKENLERYVRSLNNTASAVEFTTHGNIDINLLDEMSRHALPDGHSHAHNHNPNHDHDHDHDHKHDHDLNFESLLSAPAIPETGYLEVQNEGEGYKSIGWRFSQEFVFHRSQLYSWFKLLKVERLKAVFITPEGIFSYNLSEGILKEMALDNAPESRIEIIASTLSGEWRETLLTIAKKCDDQVAY